MTYSAQETKVSVAIVGGGPIGLELAIAFKEARMEYLLFESGQIGQAFTWWPESTTFFSTPERIAIAGVPIATEHQQRITGEHYLSYLRQVVEFFDLHINAYEPVTRVEPLPDSSFKLTTNHIRLGERTYYAEKVVLATGGMEKPNYLNIPGEDLPHVSHYFRTPHDYFRQRLLVVGARNSGVEAALRSWRAGAHVTISYRQGDFNREKVKKILMQEVDHLISIGKMGFFPNTQPVEITPEHVVLAPTKDSVPIQGAECTLHETDFVLLATGFIADMRLFREAGVDLQGPLEKPVFDPATLETNVPGLYVAGTAAAGSQKSHFDLFVETTHHHVVKICETLTGYTPRIASVPHHNYGFFPEEKSEEEKRNPISHR